MTKTAKRSLLIVSAALLVAAGAFVIVRLTAPPKDLRSALAAALRLPKERELNFFVNLPPAGSRYPGAILVAPQMLVLEPSTSSDTGIVEGDHFTLVTSDAVVAGALSSFQSDLLTTAGRDKENLDVALQVSNGRYWRWPCHRSNSDCFLLSLPRAQRTRVRIPSSSRVHMPEC